jgi:chorismate mutase
MRIELELESIRSNLIRQEETIIFSFIERSQFGRNKIIYIHGGIPIPDSEYSFMMHLLHETEKIHARVRRYTAPDEHPFTRDIPNPYITPHAYEWPIKKTDVNINAMILESYIARIIPMICEKDDDGNYGSSAVNDIIVLQALSKRIHYGKFIAESKFQKDSSGYETLIRAGDRDGIIRKLTDAAVEKKLLGRVKLKASTYGQEPDAINPYYKIKPEVIQEIYSDIIIPLTKEVEYLYLMKRGEMLPNQCE